jgi:hypothetical protein
MQSFPRRASFLAWCMALAWGVRCAWAVPSHQSLIVNGSAAWSVDGEKPFGWEAVGGDCGRVASPGDEGFAFRVTGSDRATAPFGSGFLSSGFTVFPGTLYRASAEVRLAGATGVTHLLVSWYAEENRWIGNTDDGLRVAGDGSWQEVGVADYAPADARYARLALRSDGNRGAAYFRKARVWADDPRKEVDLPLPRQEPGEPVELLPGGSVPATYAVGRPTGSVGPAPRQWEEVAPVEPPGEGGTLGLSWPPEVKGCRLVKRFEEVPTAEPGAPWALRLVQAYLAATRWLLPIWLDGAADEMFGGRPALLALMAEARPALAAGAQDPESAFALLLGDMWSSAEPASLRDAAHALASRYPDTDLRCDQVLWLQEVTATAAAARDRQRRRTDLKRAIREAPPESRQALVFELARLDYEVHDWRSITEDPDEALEAGGTGAVPPFLALHRAEALLNLGSVAKAGTIAQGMSDAGGQGYQPEVERLRWYGEIARGEAGPRPQFLGDEDDADGRWPGRFGTAAALVCGPHDSWDGFGEFRHVTRVRLATGVDGIVVRTECRQFPSAARHAPYQPLQMCQSDSFWDDRGEVWGRAVDGPDIVARFPVPVGIFRASVLTSGYATDLYLGDITVPLCSAPAREGALRLYRQFLVVGPGEYRLRLRRGRAPLTYLAGLFLDSVGPAPRPAAQDPLSAARQCCAGWSAWEETAPQGQPEGIRRLMILARHPKRPTDGALLDAARALLEGQPEDARVSGTVVSGVGEEVAALHAVAAALALDADHMALDTHALAAICRRLRAAHDFPAIWALLKACVTSRGQEAAPALSALGDLAPDPETAVAAITLLENGGWATAEERGRLAEWRKFAGRSADDQGGP